MTENIETELLQERIDSLTVVADTARSERDALRAELTEVLERLVLAEQERDRLRSDVSRLRLIVATGATED